MVAAYMPASVADREGWAADIYSAVAVLEIPVTPDNICAILSVTEQESGYRVDPTAVAEALLRRVDPRRDPLLPGPFRPRRDETPRGSEDVRRARPV